MLLSKAVAKGLVDVMKSTNFLPWITLLFFTKHMLHGIADVVYIHVSLSFPKVIQVSNQNRSMESSSCHVRFLFLNIDLTWRF